MVDGHVTCASCAHRDFRSSSGQQSACIEFCAIHPRCIREARHLHDMQSAAKAAEAMARIRKRSAAASDAGAAASSSGGQAAAADAVTTPVSKTKRAASSPSLAESSSQASQPVAKRVALRQGASFQALPSPDSGAKRSDGPDEGGEGAQTIEVGKACVGCWRAYGVDASFHVSSHELSWMYANGRGSFCRDCGNVFRVLHKTTMAVSMFDQWCELGGGSTECSGRRL